MAAMQHKGKILDWTLPAMDEFEANAFLADLAKIGRAAGRERV